MKYLLREGIASSLEAKGDFAAAAVAYRDAGADVGADMKTQSPAGRGARPWTRRKKNRGGGAVPPDPQGTPETPLRDLVEIQWRRTE